jgi:hypothetical protein
MKISITIIFVLIVTIASSCSGQQNSISSRVESPTTCDNPPQSFVWNNTMYKLKTIGDRELEPGIKLGFLACDNGSFAAQAEGPNATFNIYSYGSPQESNDLLYFGEWGRALYTSNKKRN